MNWTETTRVNSDNPNVWKYVFKRDDAVAEAVLYRYPTFEKRTVICCSTQSGCPVGCRFCGSGDYFVKSLKAEEIVTQVKHVLADHDVDAANVDKMQIMFMSMGEPLLNFKEVSKAIRTLNQLYPKSALLLSSIGPDVDYNPLFVLSQEIEQVGLQFSVHEPTDKARNKLIPFKKKLTLKEIAHLGDAWARTTGRRPFFNYCAHPDNTSDSDVQKLLALFRPEIWECTVSVVCEREEDVAAANTRQRSLADDFMGKMLSQGYNVRMFDPAGQDDIGGGCGQLWFVQKWMQDHPDKARPSAGYRLPVVHTPRAECITEAQAYGDDDGLAGAETGVEYKEI